MENCNIFIVSEKLAALLIITRATSSVLSEKRNLPWQTQVAQMIAAESKPKNPQIVIQSPTNAHPAVSASSHPPNNGCQGLTFSKPQGNF